MKDKKRNKTKDSSILFLFFCCFFIFIGGCEDRVDEPRKENENEAEKKAVPTIEPLPLIEDHEYQFQNSLGWIDEETIVYIATKDAQSYLFSYHILSQTKKELFTTSEMILEASISFNKESILLYSSTYHSNTNIQILSITGDQLFQVSIPAREISIAWSPYDEDTLLIDSFQEDWSFQSYIFHIGDKRLEQIDLPQPFAQWYSKEELVYLDWSMDTIETVAPLMKYNIVNKRAELLFENVIAFQREKDFLFLIRDNVKESGQVEYDFYKNSYTKVNSTLFTVNSSFYEGFSSPYDLVLEKHSIFSFTLNNQQEQLVSYNWETGKSTVVLEGLEVASISCSPGGKYCLYGNALEKIIRM